MKILLVEDDKQLSKLLSKMLRDNGYEVTPCKSIHEVLRNGFEHNHDLIILDLLLNGEKGEDLVINLRKRKMDIPILVLSCLSEVVNKTDLLKLGADDYLTKPFDNSELIARIEALNRRCLNHFFNDKESYGDLVFFWKQNKVIRGNREISLTRKQGGILHLLVRNAGKTVETSEILRQVWNLNPSCSSNVVQSTMRHLRERLDSNFSHKLIQNVHGIGYCFVFPTD